jgi:hypothetical protein
LPALLVLAAGELFYGIRINLHQTPLSEYDSPPMNLVGREFRLDHLPALYESSYAFMSTARRAEYEFREATDFLAMAEEF